MDFIRGRWMRFVWLVLRVWIGVQWLEAGWHKVLDPKWMVTGQAIQGFWVRAAGLAPDAKPLIKYAWYESFIRWLATSGQSIWFGKAIAVGELLVGAGLILGCLTVAAAFFGALMNLSYMLAGTTSTNPVLYTIAMLLLVAGPAAGYWGLDRVVLPLLSRLLHRAKTPSPAFQTPDGRARA